MSTNTPGLVTHLTLESVATVHARLSGLGLDWLSQEEQARLSAMSAPHRRTQFIAGRQLARQCLAARGGDRWQAYVLSAPDDDAPQLLARPPASEPWYFSLSHSGDWLACAVSSQPVGVDVECSDRVRDFPALSEWMHEPQALQDMPADPREQQAWFYAQWTLKEAILAGAAAKNWTVAQQADGNLQATLKVRGKHTVIVLITYTPVKYSLAYQDSIDMNYGQRNGEPVIHPFYNTWVGELKESIRAEMLKL